jgi:predicted MPP superfamily phosphohydrolase
MRSRLNTFYWICAIYFLLDVYTFFGLRSLFKTKINQLIFSGLYVLVSLFVYYSFYRFYAAFTGGGFFSSTSSNIYLGIVLTAIISKFVFVFFLLLQDIGRCFYAVYQLFLGEVNPASNAYFPSRRRFLTLAATSIAAIPFSTMLYGITKGKYAYTVNKVKLAFADLPAAFDGFKIVQISDIHAGSLDSISGVEKGVRMINEQQPDLIVFTGDLVNSDKDEVDTYIPVFKEMKAKYGKFCVLGNHDYYGVPDGEAAEQAYWTDFLKKYHNMGFQLMNNENTFIEKEGARICLMGVENWGRGRWFPKRGDLDKALVNTKSDEFCVLLSHDPTHWDDKVLQHDKQIHLTLSGHTHGFQFGVNMPGFKWSPAQYRYERWMGLYEEAKQYLYVNRGFGFLAFPGRIGMWPEITVIELSR